MQTLDRLYVALSQQYLHIYILILGKNEQRLIAQIDMHR